MEDLISSEENVTPTLVHLDRIETVALDLQVVEMKHDRSQDLRQLRSIDISEGGNRTAFLRVLRDTSGATPHILVAFDSLTGTKPSMADPWAHCVYVHDLDLQRTFQAMAEAKDQEVREQARGRERRGLDTAPVTTRLKVPSSLIAAVSKSSQPEPAPRVVEPAVEVLSPDRVARRLGTLVRDAAEKLKTTSKQMVLDSSMRIGQELDNALAELRNEG